MPIEYKLDRRSGIAYVKVSGSVGLAEQLAHGRLMLRELVEHLPLRVLSDRRDVTEFVDAGAIASALVMLRDWGLAQGGRIAFVVQHPHAIQLGKAFRAEAERLHVQVRLFGSQTEAQAWLEADSPLHPRPEGS